MEAGSDEFMDWLKAHYEADPDRDYMVCRRCGEDVGYVTKHAVVRHGDDIDILPPINNYAAVEVY